jgi:hypothetical protein
MAVDLLVILKEIRFLLLSKKISINPKLSELLCDKQSVIEFVTLPKTQSNKDIFMVVVDGYSKMKKNFTIIFI